MSESQKLSLVTNDSIIIRTKIECIDILGKYYSVQ